MDKFSRYYAWFLVAAAALPAVMRLGLARLTATVTFERYQDLRRRTRYRRLGLGSGLFAAAMVPLYLIFRQHSWILVTGMLGLLSGAEMVTNTSAESVSALTSQNLTYGVLYAVTAVGAYFALLRH